MVKVNNFGPYPIFDTLDQAKFDMFLTYVIKVDEREILRIYNKHIVVLLLFLLFSWIITFPYLSWIIIWSK